MPNSTVEIPLPPDDSRAPELIAVVTVGFTLSLFFIFMRLWARVFILKHMGWDDWFMVAALPFLIIYHSMMYAAVSFKFGHHYQYLSHEQLMNTLHMNSMCQIWHICTFYFVKGSIVLLELRLITFLHKVKRIILWISLAILTIISVELFIGLVVECRPFSKTSNFCKDRSIATKSGYALAAITVVTDILYIVIPILVLWDIRIPKKKKYAIFALLGASCISMVCTIVPVPWLEGLSKDRDITYQLIPLSCLKITELNVAIWVACLPALPPIFEKFSSKKGPRTHTHTYTIKKTVDVDVELLTTQNNSSKDSTDWPRTLHEPSSRQESPHSSL